MRYLHIKAFHPTGNRQPFTVINEKCSRAKVNSFADSARARGGISKEHMETSTTNQACCQTVSQVVLYSVLVFSLSLRAL